MDAVPAEPEMPKETEASPIASAADRERLWTPWRMRYVAGRTREPGCIFCNRLAEGADTSALILHRGRHAFSIMNLYPYNTGHVMLVPYAHVSSPDEADDEALTELAILHRPVLRALRRARACDGFNLGLNVGAVAGAGVTDHLHEHVVPRWQGDANFMPILAATVVMPELIPVTYAKLRAEIGRELHGKPLSALVVTPDDRVLVDSVGQLPTVEPYSEEPLWRSALRLAHEHGAISTEIAGWAGNGMADAEPGALAIQAVFPYSDLASGARLVPAASLLSGPVAEIVRAGLESLRSGS
jgi:ATP adenylyltransferase